MKDFKEFLIIYFFKRLDININILNLLINIIKYINNLNINNHIKNIKKNIEK